MRSPSQPIDDNEEIDIAAQLIIASDEDEEHFADCATPQAGDGVEDGVLLSHSHICYHNGVRLFRTIIRIGRQSHARSG
jgi:uncharacterized protein with NRDE domain